MIIDDFSFSHFLIDSRVFRKGILLTLRASNGRETIAEISPLPGFSKETLADAAEQLHQIKPQIQTHWWTLPSLDILRKMDLYPSVHFALESALTDLLEPLKEEPNAHSYALLIGTPDEILTRAKEIKEEGYEEAKVKLGHLTPQVAHEIIAELKEHFTLRLDFNRKWDAQETIEFCRHYPENQFVYMEEPSKNPEDLLEFPYPFALDESINHPHLHHAKMLKALILKPTIVYPLTNYLQSSIPCVFTSSFESGIGINQIKRLIHRLGLTQTHHGLDTLRYFEKNHEVSHLLAKAR